MTYHYQAFGLKIYSNLEIPEFVRDTGEPEVQIRFGSVPESLQNPVRTGVCFQAKPGAYLLNRKNVARYLVTEGKDILIEQVPGVNNGKIRLFLLSSVFGALLHQRKLMPLHASAIRVNNGCVLFCGTSGSGKSTIARSLMQRGYPLHTDDISVVTIDKNKTPIAFPGYPQQKLWGDALTKLGDPNQDYRRVRSKLDKFAIPTREQFNDTPLAIKKIYILSPFNQKKVCLSPLKGVEKFNHLNFQTYRPKLALSMGMTATHFKTAGIIASQVPVILAQRSIKPFLLEELADTLETDFSGD
jgi:hypothetical protein